MDARTTLRIACDAEITVNITIDGRTYQSGQIRWSVSSKTYRMDLNNVSYYFDLDAVTEVSFHWENNDTERCARILDAVFRANERISILLVGRHISDTYLRKTTDSCQYITDTDPYDLTFRASDVKSLSSTYTDQPPTPLEVLDKACEDNSVVTVYRKTGVPVTGRPRLRRNEYEIVETDPITYLVGSDNIENVVRIEE